MSALDKFSFGESVNQLNRTVVLEQHLIGDVPNHDRTVRVGLDHQQDLILLRRDSFRVSHGFAESQKLPQGIPKRREPLI